MKTQILKIKKIAIAIVFFGMLVSANVVTAAGTTGREVELVFLGNEASLSVFKLVLNPEQRNVFSVTIKANDGTILFTEKLKIDITSRVYKLNPEEYGQVKGTSFEVLNTNTGEIFQYKIETETRTTETVSIVKL